MHTPTSAPDCAEQVEREWRSLPATTWRTLAFSIMERMVRVNLARCYRRANRKSVSARLAGSLAIEGLIAWQQALAVMSEVANIDPAGEHDMDALSANLCVAANLPETLFEAPPDVLLREASLVGFIVCRFATGSFHNEMVAQRDAVARAAAS